VAYALQRATLVLPMHRGARGHPVGFAAEHGVALQTLSGAEGAAAIVRAARPVQLDLDDEGIVVDIDTVADLARVEALLRARGAG
jgi:molybdenum cofactor cytidylyltransferase